jgi:sodium/hydrogen antiporter
VLDAWLLLTGALAVMVAAISRWLDRHPLSEPLLAVTVGVLAGPEVLGLLAPPPQGATALLELVARVTLAVAMMAIALRYPLSDVRQHVAPVAWLLLAVLPAMALTGAVLATVTLGVGVGIALTIGAALAPTDPVLASAVVAGEPAERDLPAPLRRVLSVESGANDGLALSFVLVAAAYATGTSIGSSVLEAAWAVAGAVAIGGALGWGTAKLLHAAERRDEIDPTRELTFSLVLSLAALGLGGLARTADLLAVFVCGLAFNAVTTGAEREAEETIDESVNRFLILPLFVLLGVAIPWDGWRELGWAGAGFVVAVLLLRRLPWVILSGRLAGAPSLTDAAWLGWFGPIGAAAVFYLTHLDGLGVTDPVVWHAGSLAVVASTLVHGVTAVPGRRLYVRATAGTGRRP